MDTEREGEREGEEDGERKTEHAIVSLVLFHKCPAVAISGPGKAQKPRIPTGSPTWVVRAQQSSHLLLPPQPHLNKKLERSGELRLEPGFPL